MNIVRNTVIAAAALGIASAAFAQTGGKADDQRHAMQPGGQGMHRDAKGMHGEAKGMHGRMARMHQSQDGKSEGCPRAERDSGGEAHKH